MKEVVSLYPSMIASGKKIIVGTRRRLFSKCNLNNIHIEFNGILKWNKWKGDATKGSNILNSRVSKKEKKGSISIKQKRE